MKKMQDEMSKMKEELSNKVEDAISGKNDATKDTANEIGAGPPLHSLSVNLGKLPYFDGTRYIDWAYKMKMHLITVRLWEVVDVGVMIPIDEDREITLEEAFDLHQNAQAVSLLVSSLGSNEFNKVNGIESAKQIWEALRTSFEGDKSMRKGNIELLHGELERFVFLQGETAQAMFDRLMALVNRIRALGNTEWDDNNIARKMLRTHRAKNNMLTSMVMERPGSSQEKNKKVKDDSSSEEEDSDAEVAFVIRNLRKFMKKKSNRKTYGDGKKMFCYGCGQTSHFIADCPNEKKKHKHDKDEDKKNKGMKRGEAHLDEE
ncbi:uncharacterized protein [Miscanthus floridulus]|uniref:uncharacterized protein n=1 Tax=Miscanthus floridulus TaxID=154761 RepID=UPI003457CC25